VSLSLILPCSAPLSSGLVFGAWSSSHPLSEALWPSLLYWERSSERGKSQQRRIHIGPARKSPQQPSVRLAPFMP